MEESISHRVACGGPGRGPRRVGFGLAASAVALLAFGLGCQTPLQQVPLLVSPADARVFVDGNEVAPGSVRIALRSDRPHVVLARRDGYKPARLVLEPRGVGRDQRLDPAEIRVTLEPLVPKARTLRIEGAEEGAELGAEAGAEDGAGD